MNYDKLVKALRCKSLSKKCDSCGYGYHLSPDSECNDACHVEQIYADAAAAIEALQGEPEKKRTEDCFGCKCEKIEPKRGKWYTELYDGDKKYQCSNCLTHWDVETRYCPYCGAKMNDSNASNALNALDNAQDGPIITPCRGCSDYDGYGGCKSKGGCVRAKQEVQE